MTARFVDFHCHLDLYPDPPAAMLEAEAAQIYTLTVTTTPRAWARNRELTASLRYVRAALGLHPQLVAEHHQEIALWDSLLHETRYVGEVGIDAGPRFYRSLDLQTQVFEHILAQCALSGGKILTVHSVRAAKLVLELIEKHLPPSRGRVVLHWFTGSKSEARRAVDLGCFFSVNPSMLRNERGIALVSDLPRERLLTETDGPFTSIGGRPSRPRDVETVVAQLANLWQTTPQYAAELIIANLRSALDAPDAPP